MHLHVPHKPTWGVLLAITVVALPLGGIEFYRLFQMVSAQSFPLVEGRIVAREETTVLTLPAARLTIQITNSQQTVAAVMPHSAANQFSGTVRFHYSGDP